MKYFEVTFTTTPFNETVNDVVSALAGEIGFESFVEWENGVQAYVQQTLFDEEALKDMVEIMKKIPSWLDICKEREEAAKRNK